MKSIRNFITVSLAALLSVSLIACAGTPTDSTTAPNTNPDSTESGDSTDNNTGEDTAAEIQTILDRGVVRVGVKDDVPGFGLMNTETNEIEGFEIEIVKLIADELFGDPTKYELTPVTAKTRGPLIDNGEVDLIIATFTITEERKLSYNFSTAYFTDAVGLLVKKSAGYESLADMDGAAIGVAQSATSKDAVADEAEELGVSVTFSEYATYPEIKAALDSSRIQAFCVDRSILVGYLDDSTEILADRFAPQEYGVVTKLSNTALAEYVEDLISGWHSDGTLETLIDDWNLAD